MRALNPKHPHDPCITAILWNKRGLGRWARLRVTVADAVVHYEDTGRKISQSMVRDIKAFRLAYEGGYRFMAGQHLANASAPVLAIVPIPGAACSGLRAVGKLGKLAVKGTRASGRSMLSMYEAHAARRLVPRPSMFSEDALVQKNTLSR